MWNWALLLEYTIHDLTTVTILFCLPVSFATQSHPGHNTRYIAMVISIFKETPPPARESSEGITVSNGSVAAGGASAAGASPAGVCAPPRPRGQGRLGGEAEAANLLLKISKQRRREMALATRQGISRVPRRPQPRRQNGVFPHDTQ